MDKLCDGIVKVYVSSVVVVTVAATVHELCAGIFAPLPSVIDVLLGSDTSPLPHVVARFGGDAIVNPLGSDAVKSAVVVAAVAFGL